MKTVSQHPFSPLATARIKSRRRIFDPERFLALLLLTPSLVAVAIFVYGFIVTTGYVSLSNWATLKIDLTLHQPLFATYGDLFSSSRFQSDLRNIFVFTALFLTFAVLSGLLLAILLEQPIAASGIFRNIFLFPYSLSFIVTGVVWRWIFNPETGINLLFDLTGINSLLQRMGAAPLRPGWLTDPQVVMSLNDTLGQLFPSAAGLQIRWGIPVAMIPVVIAAVWQLAGFSMAMYLAGLGSISNDIREAARIDGANEWQLYQRIVIPMLTPITVSTLVILGHTSLKIFDLVFAMSGVGPGFATDVPGIFVFEKTFRANQYNLGAAGSMVMLLLVCMVIVPYLARSLGNE